MDKLEFLNRVYPEPNTGCWLWVGRLNRDGYGSLHPEDNEFGLYSAHRYSYRIHKGELNGLQVLHKCDIRCCVNPDHLFLGTQTENIKDMDTKKRRVSVRGERLGRAKLNEASIVEIRELYKTEKYKQIELSKKFGVERSVISSIVTGKTWKHVDGVNENHIKKQCGNRKRRFTPLEVSVIKFCLDSGIKVTNLKTYFKTDNAVISQIRNNRYYRR